MRELHIAIDLNNEVDVPNRPKLAISKEYTKREKRELSIG